jgi:hypothetical protein
VALQQRIPNYGPEQERKDKSLYIGAGLEAMAFPFVRRHWSKLQQHPAKKVAMQSAGLRSVEYNVATGNNIVVEI